MTSSLNFGGKKMTMPEAIAYDLIHLLLCENTAENAPKIAQTIAALFEFTGNDQCSLWLVTNDLETLALADDTAMVSVAPRKTYSSVSQPS